MRDIETAIILILEEWGNDGSNGFDGVWNGYVGLQDQIKVKFNEYYSIKELKKAMKFLKSENMVSYEPTYNVDYILNGSGYFLRESIND